MVASESTTLRNIRLIARLDITGNNLERWLLDADVRKREDVVK